MVADPIGPPTTDFRAGLTYQYALIAVKWDTNPKKKFDYPPKSNTTIVALDIFFQASEDCTI